ncbi:MAG TPA: bifunctional precorrin-2 dehydrogenase/sirohydrochlorin ferrochelatase [Holophagaceae bacterium]|nr:bifunctional precorrin-2 dehydrogenase/sirohydrochlorin ferrochelatase [Holophagaceae bacterium]
MTLLPLFLDLQARPVLLVGGGSVARAKLAALRETGADLRVVATRFSTAFRWEAKGLRLQARPFAPSDLDGVHLVIAATNDPAVNAAIASEARARGIWVNAVDDPPACDAFFASTLRRGPLTLAISTDGAFPGLSRSLRLALESLLPDEGPLHDLTALRARLRQHLPDPAVRTEVLRALLHDFETRYFALPGDDHDRSS